MSLRAQITGSGSSCEIISRLHVWSSVHHGPGPVAATGSMERTISLWDLRCVETCGSEGVAWFINNGWLEDFSSLLCDTFSKVLVVDMDTRDVTLVARDNCSLALVRAS